MAFEELIMVTHVNRYTSKFVIYQIRQQCGYGVDLNRIQALPNCHAGVSLNPFKILIVTLSKQHFLQLLSTGPGS